MLFVTACFSTSMPFERNQPPSCLLQISAASNHESFGYLIFGVHGCPISSTSCQRLRCPETWNLLVRTITTGHAFLVRHSSGLPVGMWIKAMGCSATLKGGGVIQISCDNRSERWERKLEKYRWVYSHHHYKRLLDLQPNHACHDGCTDFTLTTPELNYAALSRALLFFSLNMEAVYRVKKN